MKSLSIAFLADLEDVESTSAFDRTMTPEQIMDVLEDRVGPKGRRLFEQFLRKVNKLGAQQQLEAQAQRDAERARERGPGMPPRRRLPENAEIAVRAHMEPVLLKGGETVKSLSMAFLAGLERDWRHHGKEIFPIRCPLRAPSCPQLPS